jgi:hypothetical protein
LGWLLFARRGAPYRTLGIIFIVTLAILTVQHSKQRWPVVLCRDLKSPLDEVWRRGKLFI